MKMKPGASLTVAKKTEVYSEQHDGVLFNTLACNIGVGKY